MGNKHRTNQLNSISLTYMKTELGPRKQCPKRSCKGTCIPVLTRYYDGEPLTYELECSTCGKVLKDPALSERRARYRRDFNKKQRREYEDIGRAD